jgi:hypothetical protein
VFVGVGMFFDSTEAVGVVGVFKGETALSVLTVSDASTLWVVDVV